MFVQRRGAGYEKKWSKSLLAKCKLAVPFALQSARDQ